MYNVMTSRQIDLHMAYGYRQLVLNKRAKGVRDAPTMTLIPKNEKCKFVLKSGT